MLLRTLYAEPFVPDPAYGVGAYLVELQATGADALQRTFLLLTTRLLDESPSPHSPADTGSTISLANSSPAGPTRCTPTSSPPRKSSATPWRLPAAAPAQPRRQTRRTPDSAEQSLPSGGFLRIDREYSVFGVDAGPSLDPAEIIKTSAQVLCGLVSTGAPRELMPWPRRRESRRPCLV